MRIPGLGEVTKDDGVGGYVSDELPVKVFRGEACRLILEEYDDADKDAFHEAVDNLLRADESVLLAASSAVFMYYEQIRQYLSPSEMALLDIRVPDDVWNYVQFGKDIYIIRRSRGDHRVYASIECECAWEVEHGLQIVLRDGRSITKVGPFDGHLTYSDAFGRSDMEDVIYPAW
ncbi:hypothetical protein L2Y96_10580 [Luteibacter aegosomaticola]|uniref:DUF6985 domain-containing protein n=1 Tax=Luteibacter aegosomaticola TaxID=2911538 RepID=UPI001FF70505|nr:hypothetical protein [Luteibacter aegosomaticola]UPG92184.1 hypothetical protein L2Y96_10580 [Luteibacter aegosomaticola]